MEFKDIVAISGMSGLYEMEKQRPDGMVVRSLEEGKSRFVSNRIHTFSPLNAVAIYTDDNDSVELEEVMRIILEKGITIPSHKGKTAELKAFFEQILENYDREKVYVSDIKKVIKWFHLLNDNNLIPAKAEETETKAEDAESTDTEVDAESTDTEATDEKAADVVAETETTDTEASEKSTDTDVVAETETTDKEA